MSKFYGVAVCETDAINGIDGHIFSKGLGVRIIGGPAKLVGGPGKGDAVTFNIFVTTGTNRLGPEQLFAVVTMADGRIAVVQHSQIWGPTRQLSPRCDEKENSP